MNLCSSNVSELHFRSHIADRLREEGSLFHRTVSAVLEAPLHGAVAAALIHAFGPDTPENLSDYSEFLKKLGGSIATKGVVCGPYKLGQQSDLPTYFLWWQQAVMGS